MADPTPPPSTPQPSAPATPLGRARSQRLPPIEEPPARSSGERLVAALAPYLLLAAVAVPLLALYLLVFVWHVGPAWATAGTLKWGRLGALFLGLGLPLFAVVYFHARRLRAARFLFSRRADLAAVQRGFTHHLVHLPRVLRVAAVALLVVGAARPQRETQEESEVEGIDIVVALDVSHSMSERDLQPDRLTAAKEVLKRFIARRKSDRVGLVIFGKEAFTQCPLTLDYRALTALLDDVRLGLIDGRGTAIGNALGTALNRLRKSEAKSKVVILLTDGDNNAGNLAPEQAARYAQALGVKVFTILMGRDGQIATRGSGTGLFGEATPRYPVNPKLLETIAGETGGMPYLASDTQALERRFQSILDELDRSRFKDARGRKAEQYGWFAVPALALLLVEFVLAMTRFRRFP